MRNIWFLNIFQMHIRTLDYRSNFSSNFIVLFYWILQTIIHYFPGITRFIIVAAISKKKEPIRSSVDEFQFWEKGLVQIGQTITSVQPDVFWQRWYFTYPLRFDFVYYTQLVYTEKTWASRRRYVEIGQEICYVTSVIAGETPDYWQYCIKIYI